MTSAGGHCPLRLMGLDHEKLTYRHDGRDYRLTDIYDLVVEELFA